MAGFWRIWGRIRDHVLLAVLLSLSLLTLLHQQSEQLRLLRLLALGATAWVLDYTDRALGILRLAGENERLRQENLRLSGELSKLRTAEVLYQRLEGWWRAPDSLFRAWPAVPARVVGKDLTGLHNRLVLGIGRSSGVEPGMPVVTPEGLVGKILVVGSRYSLAQAYLNTDWRVSAVLMRQRALGVVRWDGRRPDRLLLDYIVPSVEVRPGDSVLTSGLSLDYPAGILIGRVHSVRADPRRPFWHIELEPAVPLWSLEAVFVLRFRADPERVAIERSGFSAR
ncbi:MAG: rod shape-determining protein MreC [Bacteroidetes bacterium]|nr:rod shape-determining protein MreC [Rhodothermia bacterium]MCS7155981.1 rod shape-determining protein MreC [Bacteroidota bacterium]MCX7907669.1 rod shape-determining protein MreC [Bacteroidota bacterium]MDW8137798.1 rod shape-determining protein MreC [Bacteroidota bacterium]MDW8286351.1 rod shape-determining protein MreC [Bacteroidota bacterium]